MYESSVKGYPVADERLTTFGVGVVGCDGVGVVGCDGVGIVGCDCAA